MHTPLSGLMKHTPLSLIRRWGALCVAAELRGSQTTTSGKIWKQCPVAYCDRSHCLCCRGCLIELIGLSAFPSPCDRLAASVNFFLSFFAFRQKWLIKRDGLWHKILCRSPVWQGYGKRESRRDLHYPTASERIVIACTTASRNISLVWIWMEKQYAENIFYVKSLIQP